MINEKAGHVSFGRAFKDYFRGYVEFLGKTTRAGYWWMQLLLFFVWLLLFGWLLFAIISAFMPDPESVNWTPLIAPIVVMVLVALGLFLPGLALRVRRYRDVGLRGRGAAVLLGVQYLIGMMINIGQSTQTIHQFEALRDMNTTAVASLPSGIGWVSSLVSLAFSLFFFVLTVLPSDTMLTTSDNAFVRFFIRAKEDDEPSDSDFAPQTSDAEDEVQTTDSPVDKESDDDHDHD
ncbi:DUF805 domain-containing protein [Lacticaseibacillus porcinae]|uniref:DUF805 domain-containing protein n=1 Tax=Lacticaseibacillus porcinae TaxID=1123687 RepID=UPI000F79440F|nr:DUF805 domain-containing protein [Lacticaseibacillus porcinae]